MKKLLSVLAVLFVMGTSSIFATGIGLQAGATLGGDNPVAGGAVTFKLNKVPAVFAVSIPSFNPLAVGITADWWMMNPKIEGSWGYYVAIGAAGEVFIPQNGGTAEFGFGGRAVIGTNVFVLKKTLEFYLQAAWQPMFIIRNGLDPRLLNFPVDIGFRFWF